MPIRIKRDKKYILICDRCGLTKVAEDDLQTKITSRKQALKATNMHRADKHKILCDTCYVEENK